MKIIARNRSTFGHYDVAVIDMPNPDPEDVHDIRMMISCHVDVEEPDVSTAFSNTYLDSERMHAEPRYFVKFATDIIKSITQVGDLVVIAGLGGGLIHTQLQMVLDQPQFADFPRVRLLSLEPDDTVTDFARSYFGFSGDVLSTTVEDFVADPTNRGTVGLLFVNAFCREIDLTPTSIANSKFLQDAYDALTDSGTMMVNAFDYGAEPDVSAYLDFAAAQKADDGTVPATAVLELKSALTGAAIHKFVLIKRTT